MNWENQKEEKKAGLDSWIESTSKEIKFAETIYGFLDSSSTKEEFLNLSKEELQEYKDLWIQDTLQSILNLVDE